MFSEKRSCECMGFSVFMRKIPKTALTFLPRDTVRRFILKSKSTPLPDRESALMLHLSIRNLSISSELKYKFCCLNVT